MRARNANGAKSYLGMPWGSLKAIGCQTMTCHDIPMCSSMQWGGTCVPPPHTGTCLEAKYAFPGVSREYVKHVQTENCLPDAFTAVRGEFSCKSLSGVSWRGAAACCHSSHDCHLASALLPASTCREHPTSPAMPSCPESYLEPERSPKRRSRFAENDCST